MSRTEQLKSFIDSNPNDPFPRYGLAMEYKNQGLLQEASDVFADLLGRFPDYVAGYLHAGNVLHGLDRTGEARETYRRGIEVATAKGDQHARGELEAALTDLDDLPEQRD